jgi:hypothetical protein
VRHELPKVRLLAAASPVVAVLFVLLVAGGTAPLQAQSRPRIATGFGLAVPAGSMADVAPLGLSGTVGVGFPTSERFTLWLEGSADALGEEQISTRYLAGAEYLFTQPWSRWRLSGTMGAGATTFWDNAWYPYTIAEDGSYYGWEVRLSGTHFTVAPGFRAGYSLAPNLDLELIGRVNMALYEGEAFAYDTLGVRTDLEPPGSPITFWGLTLGSRLRAGGPPSDWSDVGPGDQVRVWTLSGHQVEGRVVSTRDGRLSLVNGEERVDVPLDGLQSAAVRHTRADHGGVLGTAIGGGAGALLGLLAAGLGCSLDDSGSGCTAGEYAGATLAFGLIGGATGFLFGTLLGSANDEWSDLPVR